MGILLGSRLREVGDEPARTRLMLRPDRLSPRDNAGPPPEFTMHYPRRKSRLKRKRAIGFRARMSTKNGRKMMNRKRRMGRTLNVADKPRV
jgi:large subunit ribosomal protein L34